MSDLYLSHPVRRIREDPVTGESIPLVVELDDDDRLDKLAATVTDLDGSVERNLGFSAHLVTIPEPAVDDLCDLDSVVRIETAETLSLGVEPEATDGVGDE